MIAAALAFLLAPQEDLVEKLRSDDVAQRVSAEREFRALGRAALPILEKASRDPDPEVAARARRLFYLIPALERISPALRRAIPDVEPRLATGDPHAWTEILLLAVPDSEFPLEAPERLPGLAASDLAPLVPPALAHARPEESVRAWSRALQGWGRGAPIPDLAGALRDSSPAVRSLALSALAERAARKSIPDILQLLEDAESREAAVGALRRLRARGAAPHLQALLKTHPTETLVKTLVEFDAREALPDLLAVLRDEEGTVRHYVLEATLAFGAPEAHALLIERLKSPNLEARVGAMELLGRHRVAAAKEEARSRLKDLDLRMCRAAIETLTALEAREWADDVAPLLAHPTPDVHWAAARALVAFGHRGAVPGISRIARRRSLAALWTLGELEARETAAGLIPLLGAEDPRIRQRTVWALGRMGAEEARERVQALLADPEQDVRREAGQALTELARRKGPLAVVALLAHPKADAREPAVRHLRSLGDGAPSEEISRHLRSADVEVRRSATSALAGVATHSVLPRILDNLEDGDPDVRRNLSIAFLRAAGPEQRPQVVKMLSHRDEDIRVPAAQWLCTRGFTEGAETLVRERRDLLVLNRLRRPDLWRRLEAIPLTVRGWSVDLSEVALAIDLPLSFPEGRERDPNKKILDAIPENPCSVLDGLRHALRYNHEAILEEGEIVVLPPVKAAEFWEKWWEGESKK